MNSFFVFTAKELREQVKTFKGIVVLIILVLFGMTSPLMAKLTPELLKMANLGVTIRLPAPSFTDAYEQFFKNISQMTLIVVLLVYSGSVSGETSKGTAALMLTKRLSRIAFIGAKFVSAVMVWTFSYAVSCVVFLYYTGYLFPGAAPVYPAAAFVCMWLFGAVTISMAILSGTLFKSYALSDVTGFCLWGLTLVTSSVPPIRDGTPAALAGINMNLITGRAAPGAALVPVCTGVALTALLLLASCLIFRAKEL